jgi:hypothetical protein
MVRREGPFSVLWDDELRGRFDAAILDLIEQAPYLAVTVQIDKKAHLETYQGVRP